MRIRGLRAVGAFVAIIAGGLGPAGAASAAPSDNSVVQPAGIRGIPFVAIVEDRTGSCIDLPRGNNTPGTGAQQFRCNNDTNQSFLPLNLGNGFFLLQNRANLLCLAATGDFLGSRIIQTGCATTGADPRQWWQLRAVPQDPARLWLASGLANKCAQLDPDTGQDGTPIDLGACAFDNRMFWHFV